ncbi:beta-defensin 104A [Talpa occidentalis]|uniref:beta-defensin 104A n=1 Tax=Talpa occidentalis TaxID=50954 RepID=UPI00188EC2DB|nr:beta-defensin 104A [Talpa occidentalis]
METLVLLFGILLLHQAPPARGDLDANRICGFGTARCRPACGGAEFRIGKCPNSHPCCLQRWSDSPLTP